METIFVGKDRRYNHRFLQMCSHYLIKPVARLGLGDGEGREPGRAAPGGLLHAAAAAADQKPGRLKHWLLDNCIAYAKTHRHLELAEQTIWEVFEAERPELVPYARRVDGFRVVPASVSKTCLVRLRQQQILSPCQRRRTPGRAQTTADRVVIR